MTSECTMKTKNEIPKLTPQGKSQDYSSCVTAPSEKNIDNLSNPKSNEKIAPTVESNYKAAPSFLCFKPFTTIEIHTDGNCTFCCFIRKKIGNIENSTLEKVFNSEAAQEIRRNFLKNDYSDCDKTRCDLFKNKATTYRNIPENSPIYREDIRDSIASFSTIIRKGPSKIVESAHGVCNVKCTFCWPFKRYSRDQYANAAYHLLLNYKSPIIEVHLAGGEPFYNPIINSLLKNLIDKKTAIGITSNLTYLMDETKQLLNKSNIIYLNASINASSKEIYDLLVLGGNWENVCANLSFFKTMRKSRPAFKFGISMVVNRINYKDILSFIDFGINRFSVDSIVLHPPDESHIPDTLKLTLSDALEIRKTLKLPIFTQYTNKISSYGLMNFVESLIQRHFNREPQMTIKKNDKILSHLTQDERIKLQELAIITSGNIFVEVGSRLGAPSCLIASIIKNSEKTAKLYCVDTWSDKAMSEVFRVTYDNYLTNIESYEDIIIPLQGKSEAIAKGFDKEIDFLFINAGDDYKTVKSDVLAWIPKLRDGAQVVILDKDRPKLGQQVFKEYVRQSAYNEGALPNMYWACVLQPLKSGQESTLSSLNKQRNPSNLIQRLTAVGIPVTRINLDINDFLFWLGDFREVLSRYANSNDVFIEKCLEHYLAYKFSNPEPEQVYIDIAAAGSNWTDCLLKRGVNAYSLDLTYPEGIHGNKIGANAAATFLPDNSVDAMSLQCAFETFQGDHDKMFIRESKRILKEGGKVVISPLYLDAHHFILSSKNTDLSRVPLDEGAIRVWREDQYDEAFSRHYSPEALAERIFSNLNGLSAKLLYIDNLDQFRSRFPGQRIYCDFNLYIEKSVLHSENQPLLSVVIPTRNRAALLYNALESITKQTYEATRFEVIIVDNGSTDATAQVCQHFKQRIPNFKYISVPHPGLHNGRHAGLKESIGEILVYADDDIEAMPTWLEGIAESFGDPQIGLVGGKILPKFESQPPEWVAALSRKTDSGWSLGWYSIMDFGDTAHEIPHEYVWGCNFSIRKTVLNQAGGFHPDSLPQEIIKYRGDGETAVSIAVRDLGYKALYNPKASVHHVVSQKRLTQDYIYQRAYNQGISDSYSSIRATRTYSDVKHYNSPTNTINDIVNRGIVDGFNYHQQLAKSDEKLLAWILKESYIDCEDISQ